MGWVHWEMHPMVRHRGHPSAKLWAHLPPKTSKNQPLHEILYFNITVNKVRLRSGRLMYVFGVFG
jgi:hypothetical protein